MLNDIHTTLQGRIAANETVACAVRSNGTVVYAGFDAVNEKTNRQTVERWRDMIAVAAGENHMVGLRRDGTAAAFGLNDKGQCDVSAWTEIVAVAAGAKHTVGLRRDGTVVCAGVNSRRFSTWKDITAIASGPYHVVGLRKDGTVLALGYQKMSEGADAVSAWRNVTAICAADQTHALCADGTVLTTGEEDVSAWNHVVKIACAPKTLVALRDDGTVYGAKAPALDWSGVTDAAAGQLYYLGLKTDGTVAYWDVYQMGSSWTKLHPEEIDCWTDVVFVCAGPSAPIGVRRDGSIVSTLGQEQYADWDLFREAEPPAPAPAPSAPDPDERPEPPAQAPSPSAAQTGEKPAPQISAPNSVGDSKPGKKPDKAFMNDVVKLLLILFALVFAVLAVFTDIGGAIMYFFTIALIVILIVAWVFS